MFDVSSFRIRVRPGGRGRPRRSPAPSKACPPPEREKEGEREGWRERGGERGETEGKIENEREKEREGGREGQRERQRLGFGFDLEAEATDVDPLHHRQPVPLPDPP